MLAMVILPLGADGAFREISHARCAALLRARRARFREKLCARSQRRLPRDAMVMGFGPAHHRAAFPRTHARALMVDSATGTA